MHISKMESPVQAINRQLCQLWRTGPILQQRAVHNAAAFLENTRQRHMPRRLLSARKSLAYSTRSHESPKSNPAGSPIHVSTTNVIEDCGVKQLQQLVDPILNRASMPSEVETMRALKAIAAAANRLVESVPHSSKQSERDISPASALLSLDAQRASPNTSQQFGKSAAAISDLAHRLVIHPPIFITRSILEIYITIQSLLLHPSTFPDVFRLYAEKPVPTVSKPSGSALERVDYTPSNPNNISAAIPQDLANAALTTAIHTRSLPTALSIISTTFRAPAYRRAKIFQKAVPPLIGAGLAPVAAYALASQLAAHQTFLDPSQFTQIAFAGMFTYIAAVGTIGLVALTTSNDQMDRVTWALGMPLRERWLREEERAAVDCVAQAWGFKESWRRGEEEGAEWEGFKDWIGYRGMVLDKVGLMPGME